MAEFVRHEACDVCTSSDAKAVYDDGSWHCFSCGATNPSEEYKEEKQSTIKVRTTVKKKETALSDIKAGKAAIAREDILEIMRDTSPTGRGYRGITDETYAKVGVRHEFDEKTGKVTKQYYPITRGLVAAGYKIRYEPKTFSSIGATGRDCDLFMQRNFQQGGKYVLIVSGECDAMAAYQMLKAYYVSKGSDYEVAVVSGTTGDKSVKQIAAQYKFFETFDNIVVGYDNDASGNETVEDVIKALPKGKTRVMKMTYKDANDYLDAGKEQQFVSHFFRSEAYLPEGVVGSGKLYDKMMIQADVEKVPFPPFMQKLDSMIGSIEMSTIGIFAAGTGAAKCLGKDTPVLMSDQTVKFVQDIQNGDKLMGPEGLVRIVAGVVSGIDEMYRVTQVKGISYVVNSKHILSLRAGTAIKSLNLSKGDVYNCNIRDYLKLNGKQKHGLKGWKGSFEKLGNKFTDDNAYMLGLWLAEGTTDKPQLTLALQDITLFDELDKFCVKKGFYQHVSPSNYRDACTTVDINGGFSKLIKDFGFKSSKLIPSVYLNAERGTRLDLLAGFLDGDGHLAHNGFQMTLKINQLSTDIVTLARGLGFAVSEKKVFQKCQNFVGDWYMKINISGHTDEIPNRLTRKKASARQQIKNPLNTGITVENIGQDEYFGFELDSDHLFCLGDGTVTHNTTVANELLYYWIFNSPHKIGVVSLELTCAQYGQVLLSRHIGKKISLIKDKEEKLAFLRSDHVKQKVAEVFSDEDGNDRFMVIDEREGSIEILQDQIEELVISCGCKVIILDPVSDLMDGLSNDEQAKFAKWCKSMIKNYNIHILMIAHIRKAASNKDSASTGKFIPEEAIMGSSTFMKSASWIVMMQRDKTSEDPIVRNTTHLVLTKNRAGGETGPCGDLYYDNATHTLHDIGEYFQGIAPESV